MRLNKYLNQYHVFIKKFLYESFIQYILWGMINGNRDHIWWGLSSYSLYFIIIFFLQVSFLFFSSSFYCYAIICFNIYHFFYSSFLSIKWYFECAIDHRQKLKFNFFRLVRYNMDLYSSLIKNKFVYIYIFNVFYIYILILGLIVSLNNFCEIE